MIEYSEKFRYIILNIISSLPWEIQPKYHGTFASGKTKYVSDIDGEVPILYDNNSKEELSDRRRYVLKILKAIKKNSKLTLIETWSGYDERYMFDFKVNINGEIENYNADKIRKRLQKNPLSEKEREELLKLVKDKPTLKEIEILKNKLEKHTIIYWKYDELLKKKKTLPGNKVVKLDPFNNLLVITFMIEYEKNKFFPADITFLSLLRTQERLKDTMDNKYYNIPNDNFYNLVSDSERDSYKPIILGFFKNYAQNKYYKMLKRLRTILTRIVFSQKEIKSNNNAVMENIINNDDIRKIFDIRKQILDIYNTDLGIYSQINKRIDTAIQLIDKVDQSKVMIFIFEIIDDFLLINYEHKLINNLLTETDKDKVKQYLTIIKKDLFEVLNNKAKHLLLQYYEKTKHFLPFRLEIN